MVAGGSSLRHMAMGAWRPKHEKVCSNKSASCCITSVFYLTIAGCLWTDCNILGDTKSRLIPLCKPEPPQTVVAGRWVGSNHGRNAKCPQFCRFPQPLQTNSGTVSLTPPRLLPSTSFPINYSLAVLIFENNASVVKQITDTFIMDSHITNLIQIGSFGDQIYGQ